MLQHSSVVMVVGRMLSPGDYIPRVALSPDEVRLATMLADDSLDKFRSTRGYYRNTSRSHLLGKLGEVASELWLRQSGFDPVPLFREPGAEIQSDVVVNGLRVEVKTWDSQWWDKWGRCVAIGQVQALRAKADVVLWLTVVGPMTATPIAEIHGWSTIEDVSSAPTLWTGPEGRQVHNHQLRVADLRNPDRLLQELASHGPWD